MKKSKGFFALTILLLIGFIVFTFMIMKNDVQAIGPLDSKVGFATINKKMADMFGLNMFWYKLSKYLGYLALLIGGMFGLLGLAELIKRKSLFKVDYYILLMGLLFVIVMVYYVFFNKVAFNYRPVILDEAEGLEPSYPSSHTMLAVTIFGSAMIACSRIFKRNRQYRTIAYIAFSFLMVLMVVARMLSGVHWFTDIIGGIIVSTGLIMLYYSAVLYVEGK